MRWTFFDRLSFCHLCEERITGGDGFEVPGVGTGGVVFGQAVGAPVASAEDGVGSHLELVAELAAPPQGGEEIARGHGLREAFSGPRGGRKDGSGPFPSMRGWPSILR